MPGCIGASTPAFSLIEVLVVIAIIGLLMAILLPALSAARDAGRAAVSIANLSNLGKLTPVYAADYKGAFINPFDPDNARRYADYGQLATWASVFDHRERSVAVYETPSGRASEMFAAWWVRTSTTEQSLWEINVTAAAIAPADHALLARQRVQRDRIDHGVDPGGGSIVGWIATNESSYFYSPTFWLSPQRYAGSTAQRLTPLEADGKKHHRRNRMDQVTFPTNKVLLFERFDFTQRKRPQYSGGTIVGRESLSPTWNNPTARPGVCTVDGSVTRADMASLHALMTTETGKDMVYSPSGSWTFRTIEGSQWFSAGADGAGVPPLDGLEHGNSNTAAFPGFFWATRHGIRGRDIPR